MSERRCPGDSLEVKTSSPEDHGSPFQRAREAAGRRVPCAGCGFDGEPALRRPRHLSEAWHRDPATYFGCRRCGRSLARIDGPVVSRSSEVESDGIPDPGGTLRAFMTRDPLAPVRFDSSAGPPISLSLRSILGPPLDGIDLRSGITVRRPDGSDCPVPFAFTRHGLPWVLWRAFKVDDARGRPTGITDDRLGSLLEVESVEAVFAVAIDPTARWQAIELELPLPGQRTQGTHDTPCP